MILIYRLLAVLNFARTVAGLLTQAKAIVAAIAANPALFPAPTPSLTVLEAVILALDQAQTATKSRTVGAAAARDVKRRELKKAFSLLLAYVQWVADTSPDQARAVIEAAQMKVRVVPPRNKPELLAKLGDQSGAVNLFAKAGPRGRMGFYDWQMRAGGKTWTALPSTALARTHIDGLTPATTVSFRFRRIDADGPHAWSQVVSVLVH